MWLRNIKLDFYCGETSPTMLLHCNLDMCNGQIDLPSLRELSIHPSDFPLKNANILTNQLLTAIYHSIFMLAMNILVQDNNLCFDRCN